MNANRIWAIGTVVVIAAVLGLGWVLGVSPQLTQASLAHAEQATVAETNLAEAAKLEQMRAIFARVGELEDELDELRISVPAEVDSDLMYQLFADIQTAAQTTVKSIVTTDAVPYGSPVGGAESVPAPSSGDTAAPAVAAPSALNTVAVTFTFESQPVTSIMAFVAGLQASPRLFVVTGIDADSRATSTVTAYMFVMSDPDAPRAAAYYALTGTSPVVVKAIIKDGAPEATPTPEPTESATPTPTPRPTSTTGP